MKALRLGPPFSFRLTARELERLEAVRRQTEKRTGVVLSFSAMLRAVVSKGLTVYETRGRK